MIGCYYESSGGPFSCEIPLENSLEISCEVRTSATKYIGSAKGRHQKFRENCLISLEISHENGPPELSCESA